MQTWSEIAHLQSNFMPCLLLSFDHRPISLQYPLRRIGIGECNGKIRNQDPPP